ncbi:hypothetical protein GQX73_g3159 [Xylaria multiplex]|uniref:Arylsulfotransferase n=1 Tax=Xylaria multiplex TaxID=323545 RepID=A0A7C8IU95_9PEZI|nr:hypothetical protein GQX73_g3159 [Xylaria multiplex]
MWYPNFAFTIIITGITIQQARADADLVFDPEGYNRGRYGPHPHQYYHSADIVSPLLLVNRWDPTKADNASYIFLTLNSPVDDGIAGPIIYRADDLSLVYSEPRWSVAHNAHVDQFNGSDYLVLIAQSRLRILAYSESLVDSSGLKKTSEGDFLVSARHTHSIIFVDRQSGRVRWALGGKNNDFVDISAGNATDFAWQHAARFNNAALTQLTMFDNHNVSSTIGCTTSCSRGKHVELDYRAHTVRLISEFYHPEGLVSGFEGNYQTMQSGNVFLGWGANPTFTEHIPSGECILDVQFDLWRPDEGYPINYRAFKMNWKAYPTWDPSISVHGVSPLGYYKVYVSWNEATEVTKWRLLVGTSHDSVTNSIAVVPRAGFETEILLKPSLPFVRAVALDRDGMILGMTTVVQLVAYDVIVDVS